MLKGRIQEDLKQAMLSRDQFMADLLRGLKSAVLYAEIAAGKKEAGFDDEEIISVFQKESKKRLESAELFDRGGNSEAAEKERREYEIIKIYLPEQVDEAELRHAVATVLSSIENPTQKDFGKIISAIKMQYGNRADAALVARIIKELLTSQ